MRKELLPNGLLSVYDYGCQWQLLFKKDGDGKWQPHNCQAVGYKTLLKELNQ
jgi:hypothetical protein